MVSIYQRTGRDAGARANGRGGKYASGFWLYHAINFDYVRSRSNNKNRIL
jgi:hypothetical protein